LARQLIGADPGVWHYPQGGRVLRGTYAVGQAIYQWCANGEKLNPEALKAVYAEALERGRQAARRLVAKRNAAQLEAPRASGHRFQLWKPPMLCPACGKKAPRGATFCAYCGKSLTEVGDQDSEGNSEVAEP